MPVENAGRRVLGLTLAAVIFAVLFIVWFLRGDAFRARVVVCIEEGVHVQGVAVSSSSHSQVQLHETQSGECVSVVLRDAPLGEGILITSDLPLGQSICSRSLLRPIAPVTFVARRRGPLGGVEWVCR